MDQIKYQKQIKDTANNVDRTDPVFKEQLRTKFLETCKKYFGVPYAQRYWAPGDKLYDAPIFLDCCGLIRQVMWDLKEDFGFTIDRWNQCYQFDTLPIDLELNQMKPGDLVFYSATYYNTKLKAQKHNMVHVEVFTGGETGEQSIGARWQKGVVKYFDSYKFVSTSYYDIKFHYKSIDTWLEGICKSWCKDHEWRSSKLYWQPGKNSIFNTDEDYDQADLDAPDLDQEGLTCDNTQTMMKQQNKQCFIGQGNNPKLVKDALEARGYAPMARGMQFSDKYRFKWTQTVQEVNFSKFKEGQHLVNHIANSRIFTNKISTITTLQSLALQLEKEEVKSFLKVTDFFPSTYRLDVVADLVNFLNSSQGGYWLEKKANSNQGRGIRLIDDVAAYKEELLTKKDKDVLPDSTDLLVEKMKAMGIQEPEQEEEQKVASKWTNLNQLVKELDQTVVQKYIEKPLLLEGRKFDIRAFMMIACTKPYLVLYNQGYVRLSLNEYTLEGFKTDKVTHLTNNSVQKKHPNFKEMKDKSIWSIKQLAAYLVETGKVKDETEFKLKVEGQIKEIMRLIMEAVKHKLDRKFGCFELFGFDLLFDEQLNVQLIEINTNPAMFTDTSVQSDMLPQLIDDAVEIATSIHLEGETEGKARVEEMVDRLGEMKLEYEVVFRSD